MIFKYDRLLQLVLDISEVQIILLSYILNENDMAAIILLANHLLYGIRCAIMLSCRKS